MLHRTRRRDRYLRRLANEPLFRDVPRHLMPIVGRSVDEVYVAPGESMGCSPHHEVLIVAEGEALLRDNERRPLAVVSAGGAIGGRGRATETHAAFITAVTGLRMYVVPGREIESLAAVAPAVARAIAPARTTPPVRARLELIEPAG